jgi:hypothetical protein
VNGDEVSRQHSPTTRLKAIRGLNLILILILILIKLYNNMNSKKQVRFESQSIKNNDAGKHAKFESVKELNLQKFRTKGFKNRNNPV